MPEDDYWFLYAVTMWTLLGDTDDDGVAYLAMLHTAGYFEPRTGVDRPAFMDPVKKANSDYRLRYVAPFAVQGPLENATPAATLARPWWPEGEASFWERVEDRFVELRGIGESVRESVRTPAGEWMLTNLRRVRPGCATDPEALAHALHAWGCEADAAS